MFPSVKCMTRVEVELKKNWQDFVQNFSSYTRVHTGRVFKNFKIGKKAVY